MGSSHDLCLHEKILGVQNFWYGSNFRGFNFRTAVGDRKLNPVENNRLYGNYSIVKMLCTATDVGIYGLLASQSCYHSLLAPCWFTLWTSSRFLHLYILLISLEIFLFSLKIVPSNCTSGAVRLVNGSSDREGIVEVCYQGVWTAVDGVYWDYRDARVLCRQLGYHDKCE